MTYDAIVEAIDRQLTSEAEKTDGERLWIFKEVVGNRKNDPVTLAAYAKERDLLKTDGWKRICHYVKNEKKIKHQMKQVK
eukprot:13488387-Ditylum_brightwellii.AAC.1